MGKTVKKSIQKNKNEDTESSESDIVVKFNSIDENEEENEEETEEEPEVKPKKRYPKKPKINAELKTGVAMDIQAAEELLKKPKRTKKPATPAQIEGLNKARAKRDEIYKERQRAMQEVIDMRYEEQKLKLEKQITRKIKAKLNREKKQLETQTELKKLKESVPLAQLEVDEEYETIKPVIKKAEPVKKPVLSEYDYLRQMGF